MAARDIDTTLYHNLVHRDKVEMKLVQNLEYFFIAQLHNQNMKIACCFLVNKTYSIKCGNYAARFYSFFNSVFYLFFIYPTACTSLGSKNKK